MTTAAADHAGPSQPAASRVPPQNDIEYIRQQARELLAAKGEVRDAHTQDAYELLASRLTQRAGFSISAHNVRLAIHPLIPDEFEGIYADNGTKHIGFRLGEKFPLPLPELSSKPARTTSPWPTWFGENKVRMLKFLDKHQILAPAEEARKIFILACGISINAIGKANDDFAALLRLSEPYRIEMIEEGKFRRIRRADRLEVPTDQRGKLNTPPPHPQARPEAKPLPLPATPAVGPKVPDRVWSAKQELLATIRAATTPELQVEMLLRQRRISNPDNLRQALMEAFHLSYTHTGQLLSGLREREVIEVRSNADRQLTSVWPMEAPEAPLVTPEELALIKLITTPPKPALASSTGAAQEDDEEGVPIGGDVQSMAEAIFARGNTQLKKVRTLLGFRTVIADHGRCLQQLADSTGVPPNSLSALLGNNRVLFNRQAGVTSVSLVISSREQVAKGSLLPDERMFLKAYAKAAERGLPLPVWSSAESWKEPVRTESEKSIPAAVPDSPSNSEPEPIDEAAPKVSEELPDPREAGDGQIEDAAPIEEEPPASVDEVPALGEQTVSPSAEVPPTEEGIASPDNGSALALAARLLATTLSREASSKREVTERLAAKSHDNDQRLEELERENAEITQQLRLSEAAYARHRSGVGELLAQLHQAHETIATLTATVERLKQGGLAEVLTELLQGEPLAEQILAALQVN